MSREVLEKTHGSRRRLDVIHRFSKRLIWVFPLLLFCCGALIHMLFLAGYEKALLQRYVDHVYLASLVLRSDPETEQPRELQLLEPLGILGYSVQRVAASAPDLTQEWRADAVIDLTKAAPYRLFRQTAVALLSKDERVLQVVGSATLDNRARLTVLLAEQPVTDALAAYSRQLLVLTAILSLLIAILFLLAIRWLIARSLAGISYNLQLFRQDPADPDRVLQASGRQDAIGTLERELAQLQQELRAALAQQSRLAVLGTAVSKINHDLKSILSTVSIASARLVKTDDPTVRRIAPLLVDSVEKAVHLCTQTQDLARGDQLVPKRIRITLYPLIDNVGAALNLDRHSTPRWYNDTPPDLEVDVDPDRLYRILLNLGRNAAAVLSADGVIRITAQREQHTTVIDLCDNGPGIDAELLPKLFQAFAASKRSGGVGLGLATARELARAHRGDLRLLRTGPDGSCFRITLPDAGPEETVIEDRRKRLRL